MSSSSVLYIPVRSKHIKQYFEKKFGKEPDEPINVYQNSLIGNMVLMNSAKLPYRVRRPDLTEGYWLRIQLPKVWKHRTMTPEQRELMGKAMDKLFQTQLYTFIEAQAAVTQSEWGAIRCFGEIYELDTESYDVHLIYKVWRDYKNSVTDHNQLLMRTWYANNKIQPSEAA